jgi:hypothetical protein
MGIFGSSWNEDVDDYDGPMFGPGREDHNERKEIRKQLKEKYDYDSLNDVPDHLVWEKFYERRE